MKWVSSASRSEAEDRLLRYLAGTGAAVGVSEPPLKRVVRGLVPVPLRPVVRPLATDLLSLRERHRAAKIARRVPLRLHLGSGRSPKTGWVNVDLFGDRVDLAWNLHRPLPFEDDSVDAAFHEHLLEHFTLRKGTALTQECYRVLKPGGVLRVGVPDAAAYVQSYLQEGGAPIASAYPGRPTPLLAMQEVFYRHGHRTMYDFDTLALVCNAAGFVSVERRRFGESHLTPCPDSEHRRPWTLYVEALK